MAQASLPVALNSNATLSSGLSAVERAWVGSLLQPSPSSSSSSSSIGASSKRAQPARIAQHRDYHCKLTVLLNFCALLLLPKSFSASFCR